MMRKFAFWILIFVLQASQARAEVITLNAEDDWAPYCSVTADKKSVEGLSPDLIRAAFATQKVQVRFRPVPYSRCIAEVLAGKAIGCFDSVLDDKTKADHIHHKTPLFSTESGIWAAADSVKSGLSFKDLEGEVVGITNGYNYFAPFVADEKIKKESSNTELSVMQKIAMGRIKYGIVYEMPGYLYLKNNPDLKSKVKLVGTLSTDPIYVSFSKKHPEGAKYAEIFEKGLRAIKANGTYEKIEAEFKANLKRSSGL